MENAETKAVNFFSFIKSHLKLIIILLILIVVASKLYFNMISEGKEIVPPVLYFLDESNFLNRITGDNKIKRITDFEYMTTHVVLSPDMMKAYVSVRSDTSVGDDIYYLNEKSKIEHISDHEEFTNSIGDRIFTRVFKENNTISVYELNGNNKTLIADNCKQYNFSLDGKNIYYINDQKQLFKNEIKVADNADYFFISPYGSQIFFIAQNKDKKDKSCLYVASDGSDVKLITDDFNFKPNSFWPAVSGSGEEIFFVDDKALYCGSLNGLEKICEFMRNHQMKYYFNQTMIFFIDRRMVK